MGSGWEAMKDEEEMRIYCYGRSIGESRPQLHWSY